MCYVFVVHENVESVLNIAVAKSYMHKKDISVICNLVIQQVVLGSHLIRHRCLTCKKMHTAIGFQLK